MDGGGAPVDDDLDQKLKLFNTLYAPGAGWREIEASKRHQDKFGDVIEPGEFYLVPHWPTERNYPERLSLRSFRTLFSLVFEQPGSVLPAWAQEVCERRFQALGERMNAVPSALRERAGRDATEVDEATAARERELDALHPLRHVWSGIAADQLQFLVWSMSTVELARRFGVSDAAVTKRCKALGIEKPPRGFWSRVEAGRVPHPNGIPSEIP